uniref:Si:ch211-215k15.4 n=1 Tax=Myripristis murdjan TaxID=586833 RepID=A0A667XUE7_9TELE
MSFFSSTKSCLIGCSCTAQSFVVTIHNLALRGRAMQSSVYSTSIPMNAIDGNRDTSYERGACSITQYSFSPWWRLDLLKTYKVVSVSITNRDYVPERINGAEIRIGNSLDNNGNNNPRCAVVSHIAAGVTENFQCNGMEGRYINIVIPGRKEYLTLCEVEVYALRCITNLALRGQATQSSLYPLGIPMNAIDGNRDTDYGQGSCSHTQDNFSPWWRLDLLKTYKVDSICTGNSRDSNGNNNPRCAVVSHIVGGVTETFQCNGMVGRYVNIVVPGRKEYLTLCEVEVYGYSLD